jgi:DNA repair protein RecN (Recombination protein N)
MARLAAQISRLDRELQQITQGNSDNADRRQVLAFQLTELDEAIIADGEYDNLTQAQALLGNAQALIEGIKLAEDSLFHNENNNVSSDIGKQINALEQLSEFDTSLAKPIELLNSALAQIEEVQTELGTSLAKIEQDPERLQETDQRLDTLINLARKHRCTELELVQRHKDLKADYQRMENQHAKPEKLQEDLLGLRSAYTKVAQIVSSNRQTVAAKLSAQITEQMQNLGMRGGRLEIQIEPQINDSVVVSENGIDQIEYQVSTNRGMPLQALNRTASGGELSRISLAIQVITSEQSQTPCLVFDEVDVGVGGKVAGIIGNRLHTLGKNAQVICITHLPQVAAQGDHHLAVDKVSSKDGTYSTLVALEDQMRTDEIARMLGGTEITDRTRAHAQEMLGNA